MINDNFNDFFETDLSLSCKDRCAILEEKSNTKESQLKKFKINCKPFDFKMIKSDKIVVNNLFKGKGLGQKKHCDYLIITNDKSYFIELQTAVDFNNNDSNDYIIQQFKGTLCITDYIDSVIVHFYKKDKFFEKIDKRYILFCKKTPISKTTTRFRDLRNEKNDMPDKFKIIQVENDGVVAIEELG